MAHLSRAAHFVYSFPGRPWPAIFWTAANVLLPLHRHVPNHSKLQFASGIKTITKLGSLVENYWNTVGKSRTISPKSVSARCVSIRIRPGARSYVRRSAGFFSRSIVSAPVVAFGHRDASLVRGFTYSSVYRRPGGLNKKPISLS